jgi:DNA-directed RNA polymerase specialized sigma24 family protein
MLVWRCSRGDRQAFDLFWEPYRGDIFRFLFARVGDLEEAQDLTQETFLRAWLSLSQGTLVAAPRPWLRQIALHAFLDWADHQRCVVVLEPLEDPPEEPAPGLSVEQAAELRWSWEFLCEQLDEVLISHLDTPAAVAMGSLRKRAFLSFYVESLTLPQIQAALTPQSQKLGLSAPTLTQLNNWLSRGDLLSQLVRHLLREHPDWILPLTQALIDPLSLPPLEADIARLRWQEGLSLEAIAERTGRSFRKVSQITRRIARRLDPLVWADLKARLHESRKQA